MALDTLNYRAQIVDITKHPATSIILFQDRRSHTRHPIRLSNLNNKKVTEWSQRE